MRHLLPIVLLATACTGVDTPSDGDELELLTTVELTLGGSLYTWTDPELDGSPVVDPITLTGPGPFPMTLRFLDRSGDPEEDITTEILEEADEHQVFVGGPITWTYGDTDGNGLPLGLQGTLAPDADGTLQVVLRHLPPVDGTAVKVAGLAEVFANDGVEALPGETDADVSFPLTWTP